MAVASRKRNTAKAASAPPTRMTRSRTKAAADTVKTETSPAARCFLDFLSHEILQKICHYVATSSRSGLFAFSQADRRCLAASSPSLFQKIKFTVVSRKKVQQDVERCKAVLDRRSSWMHVQIVLIHGSVPLETPFDGDAEVDTEMTRYGQLQRGSASGGYIRRPVRKRRESHAKDAYENDHAWEPLSRLLENLTALSDLVYDCRQQPPPSILRTLHQYLPSCRLHMANFHLCSSQERSDAHERDLVTSPSLHSVSLKLNYPESDRRNLFRVTEEQQHRSVVYLLREVISTAPNLAVVELSDYTAAFPPILAHLVDGPEYTEPLLHHTEPAKWVGTASLTHLALGTEKWPMESGILDRRDLIAWNKYVDFSALRVLKLEMVKTEALEWVATACSFGSLQTLVLDLDYEEYRTLGYAERSEINRFLRSLPQLTNLDISGGVNPGAFRACIEHHGPALRRLCVKDMEGWSNEAFFADLVDVFQQSPLVMLEDFTLSVRRSKGEKEEVAVYRLLGALPRLQTLTLNLDCADGPVSPVTPSDQMHYDEACYDLNADYYNQRYPLCEDFHEQVFRYKYKKEGRLPTYGSIRDIFINSALDERLAQDIY